MMATSPQTYQQHPQMHQAVPIPQKGTIILPSTSSSEPAKRGAQPKGGNVPEVPMDEQEMAEMADCVPEIVVMHARDSSLETVDTATTPGGSRKLSASRE